MVTPSVFGSTRATMAKCTDLAVLGRFSRCLPANDDKMKSRGKIPRTKLTGLTAHLALRGRWQVCEVTFRCRADTVGRRRVLVARGALFCYEERWLCYASHSSTTSGDVL